MIMIRTFSFAALVLVSSLSEAATHRFDEAMELRRTASQGKLDGPGMEAAGALLADQDLFVRAVAEWAIATQVGIDNNGVVPRWPKATTPDWYRVWIELPQEERVEMDWVRQAVSLGLHADPVKLVASMDDLLRRAQAIRAEGAVAEITRLRKAMTRSGMDVVRMRALWIAARRALRPAVLSQAAIDFDQILFSTGFAPIHAPNVVGTHTAWTYKPGGDLCLLSGLRTGHVQVEPILAGRLGPGHVHGLDLWFDADRVVFAWAQQTGWPRPKNCKAPPDKSHHHEARMAHEPPHLYEINLDGTGLRQLTDDPYWTDVEPAWLPNGGIAFTSDRCAHGVICDLFGNDEANLNLYARLPDGTIRRLTNNKDIDRHAHLLDNGLLVYTRWEYQERHFWDIHSLWTVRPDGTMADALFKQHLPRPMGLRDARPVPGSAKLVSIATGHHTYAFGPVMLIDAGRGINSAEGLRTVTPGVIEQETHQGPMKASTVAEGGVQDAGGFYQTPYALSETCFLAPYSYATGRPDHLGGHVEGGVDSNGMGLYLIDVFGNKELLYRDPLLGATSPIPVKRRPRPPVQPDMVKPAQPWATCVLSDVYHNIGPDVKRGSIKWLRISEALPWPLDAQHGSYKWVWGAAYASNPGQTTWNPVRVIGLVPVADDGSAHFQVPTVNVGAVYFQTLDEDFLEVRRMRSSVSFQPGETRSCYGCHESQSVAATSTSTVAVEKTACRPTPPSWGADRALGYEWLIQPILDRHCVRCHDGAATNSSKLDLTARKVMTTEREMNQSYLTLLGGNIASGGSGNAPNSYVWISNRFSNGLVTKAYQFGSARSKLVEILRKGHEKVKLEPDEWLRLVTWIDANAPYYDRFIDKRPADGGAPERNAEFRWPAPFSTDQKVNRIHRE